MYQAAIGLADIFTKIGLKQTCLAIDITGI